MADEFYKPIPFLYVSRGLDARHEVDRVPDGYYIQLVNFLEREENSLSSRYGTQIVNRSPSAPGTNFFFPAPVTSLSRLLYLGQPYRYAGTSDGLLYRRLGDSQGSYSQIYSGLSGQPFQTLVTTCYETSQAFLFIYDEAASIKDMGTGTPQLTGIDPPPQTANAQPYSPLLTLIDNFASGNAYTTSGFDSGTPWAYGLAFTVSATSSQMVTDFPEFFGASTGSGTVYNPATGGTSVSVTQFGNGSDSNTSSAVSGYPSVPITSGESVSITVNITATVTISSGFGGGEGTVTWQQSNDGGSTWTSIYSWSFSGASPSSNSLPSTNITTGFSGSNLDLLQFNIVVTSTVGGEEGGAPDCTTSAQINSAPATVTAAAALGGLISGMLSVLNTNPTLRFPVLSAFSSDLVGSFYQELTLLTTGSPTMTASENIAIYGSSNDLVDGFYSIASVTASNSFTVPYLSSVYLSAAGGYVMGGAATGPSTCVLANNYASPYPAQFSAWGFYQQVPLTQTSFPVGNWGGKVDTNTTATVQVSANFDLSQNDQVTDYDLIVLTIQVGAPANIASIQIQFDVNDSDYTSSYYTSTLSPAYYQGSIAGQISAYSATQGQILADAIGLLTGQQPTGSTSAQLSPSNFATGSGAWAVVYIPRGNFLPVGNAGQPSLDWSNITGWRLVITTTATAITGDGSSTVACNGLYLQWGYGPSSFAGVGYDWRYTYYDSATGTESSPAPEQQFNEQFGYLASLSSPFYFRQAAQVTGQYSSDPQVTHLRIYRRGGLENTAANWFLDSQVLNVTGAGQFYYKDVIADTYLAQASPLALDNDPPVTSTLPSPILTTLSQATTGPGTSIYSLFNPQVIFVEETSVQFVANQTVLVGNANNLEEVLVIAGGTGQFSAILRLQHNAGEQVSATSIPRQHPSICALAYGLVYVVDPLNPANVSVSKPGYPENFSPASYIPVAAADDEVTGLINWRGTLLAATLKTWYILANGSTRPQPTGSAHGLVATQGWTLIEGGVLYQATDGWRVFSGADGEYTTLPVEWMFRNSPVTVVPKVNPSEYSQTIMAMYQNQVYGSFVSSASNNYTRYRLRWDSLYQRFGLDDIPATAMLWEQDSNTFLLGKQVSATGYAVVQDWVGDFDDGGWAAGGMSLVQTPVNLTIQSPFRDLGKPHFPKQWNMLEGDYNTQNQPIQTTLFFKGEEDFSLALPAQNQGAARAKYQFQIPATQSASDPLASGVQAYSMSIQHQMAVTVAPVLFQENVYAEVLADLRTSFDSYWQKFEGDYLGILPKNLYCDYTASAQLQVSIYADGSLIPYYTDPNQEVATLTPQVNRSVVRVQLPARKGRLWRVIITSAAPFQLWAPVKLDCKPLLEGSGYQQRGFPVYE